MIVTAPATCPTCGAPNAVKSGEEWAGRYHYAPGTAEEHVEVLVAAMRRIRAVAAACGYGAMVREASDALRAVGREP